ncbi:HAD-IIA family hydrolase [Schlesneria paludicola]|uniref:HAD-IIA family hydrolase n=1 Tax=Schlesneria paludicola TaxID=360056 RepID=UPI000299EE67|nr:HAD-IIA family hydrolase [Schlesneria paludicola]
MAVSSSPDLRNVRGVLFDMDGVIYVGTQLLPGVQEMFDYLEKTGRRWLCVTNNASRTPAQFVEKLTGMNVRARPEQILGSAEASAAWLADQIHHHGWPKGKVIIVGQDGLRAALKQHHFELTMEPAEATYAIAGINFELTYEELARTALAIRNGARFIGTNSDPSYPSERGLLPGAGSILALLEAATGVKPIVIGKPNRGMYDQAIRRIGASPHEVMMVGDRYDTDISGAQTVGLVTTGVLTGVSSRHDFESATQPPDLIAADLIELRRRFEEQDAA